MMFSVIIPSYNSSRVISHAVESILKQSYSDFEILLMDGASKDDTVALVQGFSDKRIRVFSEPDKGIYDAMNKGIAKARGEWLYFMGSDDWLVDDRVLENVSSHISEDLDVVYGDVDAENLEPAYSGEWSLSNLVYNRCHQCVFYRRRVFDLLGSYDLKYKVLADFDMNLKWFFSRRLKHQYIPVRIAHYSDGGFSSTNSDDDFGRDYPKLVIRRGFGRIPVKDFVWLLKECHNR